MPKGNTNKNLINVTQVFQHYLTFCGDTKRTAVALGIPEETVKALEAEEQWQDAIREWNELRSGSATDVQTQISRAVNFVQAHRLRTVVDRMTSYLVDKTAEELVELFTEDTEKSHKFSMRPLADLIKGAEAVQAMVQRALGDAPGDKSKPGTHAANIAMRVQKAMLAAEQTGLSSVAVVRQELQPQRLASGSTNAPESTKGS